MAAEAEAYALAAVSQAPEPFRRMLLAVFGGRPGITNSGDWVVTQRGAGINMSVDVAAGTGLVLGSESAAQGGYFCQSTSVTNVTITAANVTNPRRDLIVARIRDNQYATGPNSDFTIVVITGTAAASPVDPTVSANCLVLARVTVAANATTIANAVITDLRTITTGQTRASGLGGIVVATSTARPTVNLYEGLYAYETDTDHAIVYDGANWVEVGGGVRVGVGSSTVMVTSFGLVTGATLTLPAGKWVIQAKGAEVQTGTATQYDARIRNTTDSTDIDTITIYGGAGAQRIPWSMMGTLSNTSSKTVRVEHMVGTLNATQTTDTAKIWARPVGSIV